MKNIQSILDLDSHIQQSAVFTLITHQGPDGDAIGSVLGLYHYLKFELGKTVHVLVPDHFPDFLSWMPASDTITVCFKNETKAKKLIKESNMIFCLDFNNTSRVKIVKDEIVKANAIKVLIDHHPHPEDFANFVISDTSVSSTAELIYQFIKQLNGKISPEIATCLFTGIVTDTGGFNHNSSKPETFEIVAELLKAGIDKTFILEKTFNNYSTDRMRLMGYCLHKKMKIFPEHKTALISLSKKELQEFNFKTGDTEGFVNLPLSIDGVIFSALFIEKDDIVKTSFRSKGKFGVNIFSGNHFNGGGHTNAAGGESHASLDETIDLFESLLPQYKNDILSA